MKLYVSFSLILNLVVRSLSGNQLSDQIPPEIGDIASLEELLSVISY